MIIEEIFSSSKEIQVNQINLAETYLIELLHTTYGKKCLNKVLVGGGGQHHNEGDNHKIYIMYNNYLYFFGFIFLRFIFYINSISIISTLKYIFIFFLWNISYHI